jgi:putative DNA primase/helicase
MIGIPSTSKTTVAIDMAARTSRGMPWPDGAGNAPRGKVLVLSAEDDCADTLRPRLDAAGGDPAQVFMVDGVRDGSGKRMFSLRYDLGALRDCARKVGDVRLVIIDPLSAYLDGADDHKNGDVRGLLGPVSELAAEIKATVLGISHLSKNAGNAAIHRALGSVAYVAAARAVWGVVKDTDDPARRLMLPVKQNLSADMGGLAFTVDSTPDGPAIAWGDRVDVQIDDAMRPDADGGAAHTEAEEWLADALAAGPVAAAEIKRRAAADSIAERTLTRAKKTLGVSSRRAGFGGDGAWVWALPEGGQNV